MSAAAGRRLLIDGMNVIGSRPTGWWRDRDAAVRQLVERLRALDEDLTAVFDGRPLPDLPEGDHDGVDVRYAQRRGPDAADDRIVSIVQAAADPARCAVVTSDRELRDRVRALGAEVMSAGELLGRLDAHQP